MEHQNAIKDHRRRHAGMGRAGSAGSVVANDNQS